MRYLIGMDVRDVIRNNLKYALWLTGGYAALADKSKSGSAKYFEQVATGFQGEKDKTPRSLGPKVSASVAEAIGEDPSWMYQEHQDLWGAIGNRENSVPGTKELHSESIEIKAPTNNQLIRDLSDDEATILAALPLSPQKSKKQSNLPKANAGISPEAKNVIDRLCSMEASGSSSPQLIAAIESILDLVAPNASPDGYAGLKNLKPE